MSTLEAIKETVDEYRHNKGQMTAENTVSFIEKLLERPDAVSQLQSPPPQMFIQSGSAMDIIRKVIEFAKILGFDKKWVLEQVSKILDGEFHFFDEQGSNGVGASSAPNWNRRDRDHRDDDREKLREKRPEDYLQELQKVVNLVDSFSSFSEEAKSVVMEAVASKLLVYIEEVNLY